MQCSGSRGKFIGILGVILGLLCFGSFFVIEKNKLIIPSHIFFPAKYFVIILIANCGAYLIIFGVLNYFGKLVPYYSKKITEYEKAKHHLLAIILSLPVWVSISSVIYLVPEGLIWKVFGSLALIYIAWLLISSVKILKNRSQPGGP